MRDHVSELLAHRQVDLATKLKRGSIVAALLLHIVLPAGLFLAPALFAEKKTPLRFVEVTVLPAAALAPGRTAAPAPKRTAPVQPKAPEVKPEPKPPVQEAPPEVPRLQEKTKPEPTTQPTESQQPSPPDAREQGVERDVQRPAASTGLSAVSQNAALQVDPDFRYGYYLEQMLALIRNNWDRPALRGEIQLVVSYRVLTDGKVEDIKIVESSRITTFDLSGVDALQRASPFPPLPRGYRKPTLNVTLIFR
jgi:TonB family protein